MKLAVFSALLLFVGLACSGPISKEDTETVVVNEDFYIKDYVIYTSQNDIVNIFLPLNSINFDDDDENENDNIILFFVEKDLASGEDRGLFIRNNTKVTKILDTGRDIAATTSNDNTKIYFAASDGIYIYNLNESKAEKYGSVTDDLINIAVVDNTNDILYVLTKNKELFKVTDNGEKKVKISDVSNAEQIVMDYKNNLYFYTTEKDVYVINEGGIKKMEGLPENPNELTLLRPPFIIDDGVPLVVDDKAFLIYSNGTVETTDFVIEVKPTAYSMEAALMQYYAYKKKIYEYNVLAILLTDNLEELKNYLQTKNTEIQTIATRRGGHLRHQNRK